VDAESFDEPRSAAVPGVHDMQRIDETLYDGLLLRWQSFDLVD